SHHTTTPIASAKATAAANAGQTAWSRERRRSLTKSEGLAYGEVYPQATQEGLARRSEPVGDAYQDTRLRLDQVEGRGRPRVRVVRHVHPHRADRRAHPQPDAGRDANVAGIARPH